MLRAEEYYNLMICMLLSTDNDSVAIVYCYTVEITYHIKSISTPFSGVPLGLAPILCPLELIWRTCKLIFYQDLSELASYFWHPLRECWCPRVYNFHVGLFTPNIFFPSAVVQSPILTPYSLRPLKLRPLQCLTLRNSLHCVYQRLWHVPRHLLLLNNIH